jgi:hypothetical protein
LVVVAALAAVGVLHKANIGISQAIHELTHLTAVAVLVVALVYYRLNPNFGVLLLLVGSHKILPVYGVLQGVVDLLISLSGLLFIFLLLN